MEHNYIDSIKEHVLLCIDELNTLAKITDTRKLTTTEYYATERLLQVLIEAAIGLAKQWTKELKIRSQ